MTRQDQRGTIRNSQKDQNPSSDRDMTSWKPGSEAGEAKNVGAKGDFGVPVGAGRTPERDYVSANTKRSDPGAAPPRSGEDDGGESIRTTGAGGFASGDGSSSGGDLDPDVVGVGTGGSGIAASGPDSRIGAAASDGSSDEFASGPHAQGRQRSDTRPGDPVLGTVVSPSDDASTGADAQGGAAASNPSAGGDDSFAGEVSLGEAMGEDNPMPTAQP